MSKLRLMKPAARWFRQIKQEYKIFTCIEVIRKFKIVDKNHKFLNRLL